MKVAIASQGNSLESKLDKSFGRCNFFVVYDTENKTVEFIENPNKDDDEKAGSKSVQMVSTRNVSKIISSDFGLRIKPLLDSLKIQMIVLRNTDKTIGQIIGLLSH
ncbi:MAG TPA: NifB/NifX family molybdenum-iron cluster-binding protein [Bacteroidales bacterium]